MSLDQTLEKIEVKTTGAGFIDLTELINQWIIQSGIIRGIINITALHTSCSLTINENADRNVLADLSEYMKAIVPELGFRSIKEKASYYSYKHKEEGKDDMPAHIKTSLTSTCLTLSIDDSKLSLGTWQAIYLWEHRESSHIRILSLHAMGEINKSNKDKKMSSTSNILSRTNPEKLNHLVRTQKASYTGRDNEEFLTKTDLIIDRIHSLTESNQSTHE